MRNYRLSESQEAESGIGPGRHLEKWGNRFKGVPESRVICGLAHPAEAFRNPSATDSTTMDERRGFLWMPLSPNKAWDREGVEKRG